MDLLKYIVFVLIFSTCLPVASQDLSQRVLEKLGDEELLDLFNEYDQDTLIAEKIARVYLNRGKFEKDTVKIARGYDRLANVYIYKNNKKVLKFADSIILLTHNVNHKTYPTLGYILKGLTYNWSKSYKNALDNFLIALKYSEINENIYLQIYINKLIINIKHKWGNPSEAITHSKKHLSLIKNIDFQKIYNNSIRKGYNIKPNEHIIIYQNEYLHALDLLINSYINSKKYDSAHVLLNNALNKSIEYNNKKNYYNFISYSGEVDYYIGDYEKAIDSFSKIKPFLESDISRLNAYFFIGSSLVDSGKYNKGINYLLKADSIYNKTRIIEPKQSNLFLSLYNHYKRENNNIKQIEYLNKMLHTDSVFKNNYMYIDFILKRDYEIPKIISEKEDLIKNLEKKNQKKSKTIWWSLVLLVISLLALYHFIIKQIKFKKRFDQLMHLAETKKSNKTTNSYSNEISKDIIEDILDRLDQFEENRVYLSQNVSLMGLAKEFGTNYKYLSRIINLNKAKRFSSYINDMRVKYVFEELKHNTRFRRYTIKAIAAECGFNNPESFNKAFYKVYGIYPSYYIKQLENKK
jgi:AraC-like DNA-binding protein